LKRLPQVRYEEPFHQDLTIKLREASYLPTVQREPYEVSSKTESSPLAQIKVQNPDGFVPFALLWAFVGASCTSQGPILHSKFGERVEYL